MRPTALALIGAALAGPAAAGDLVYQPVNPSFGGNPLNGSFLLNNAQLQNDFEEPGPDPIEEFSEGLQARFLGRVSAEIENRIFGESPEDSGEFALGDDLEISFERIGNVIELMIIDLTNGATTEIEIPAPAF